MLRALGKVGRSLRVERDGQLQTNSLVDQACAIDHTHVEHPVSLCHLQMAFGIVARHVAAAQHQKIPSSASWIAFAQHKRTFAQQKMGSHTLSTRTKLDNDRVTRSIEHKPLGFNQG